MDSHTVVLDEARVTCNNNKREWTKIYNVNIRYNIEGHNYNNTIQQLSPTSRLVWMLPAAVGVWGRRGACPLVVQAPPPLERSTRPTPLYSETRSGRPDKGQQSNLHVYRQRERITHTPSFQKTTETGSPYVYCLYEYVSHNHYSSKSHIL